MPVFGRPPGRPSPLPFDTIHRSPGVRSRSEAVCRRTDTPFQSGAPGLPATRLRLAPGLATGFPAAVPPQRRPPANRPPSLESEPGLSANRPRCPSTPFTLTRQNRALELAPPAFVLRSSWGAPSASARCAVPVVAGEPVTRCTASDFSLRPDSLSSREPNSSLFLDHPEVTVERLGFSTPVGVRCPVREIPSRTRNTRSRVIFESPGLSTKFLDYPQVCTFRPPFVHTFVTELSPGLQPGFTPARNACSGAALTPAARHD